MLKIAILSDIHANLPALKAVLEDIDTQQADQIYCLGDLVDFAPWPNETIDLLREKSIATIMGNHDERIAFDLPLIPLKKHSQEESEARIKAIEFTRREITIENKQFLKSLPRQLRLQFLVANQPLTILLAHGSSRTVDEYIYEDHDEADLIKMLDSAKTDTLIVGHTHLSFVRHITDQKKTRSVINCGSVGRTKENNSLAAYLIITADHLSINYQIRKIPYDTEETAQKIRNSSIPDFYADFLDPESRI